MKSILLLIGSASAVQIRSMAAPCFEANVPGVSCSPTNEMLFAEGTDEDDLIDVQKDGKVLMYQRENKEDEHNVSK